MKVCILTENHFTEGGCVLGVFSEKIDEAKIRQEGRERSFYSDREADSRSPSGNYLIEYTIKEYKVEGWE